MDRQRRFLKLQQFFMIFCAVGALLTLVDYRFSKETIRTTITDARRSLENKYNVGRNYYYGYSLETAEGAIVVSKEFQEGVSVGQEIRIKKSLFFDEVNQVTAVASGDTEVYSLRTASGLLLPSLVLVILGIGFTLKNKVSTLVFVMQVVLLVNLFLLLK